MSQSFYMHPATYAKVVAQIGIAELSMPQLGGVPIYVNEHMPIWNTKWQFPSDPFVDYEKSDEKWAKPVGYGCEVDDVGNHLIMAMNDWKLPYIAVRP